MIRRKTPKLEPPEPPAPCPECDERLKRLETKNRTEHEGGAVTGDLACPECGEIVDENALLREPDHV